jgi:voltage-gated potassium channel
VGLVEPAPVGLRRWLRRAHPPWPFPQGALWRRFEVGLALLVAVLVFGTCGYMVVGLGPFDAFYQTAITISTVGYGETGPESEVDRAYRAFTLVLVLVGASSAVYTASVLLETLVEGALDDGFRRRRMQRRVNRMSDHVIVAGWGRVGRAIAGYARHRGMPVVAVDDDPTTATDDIPLVVGDASEEETLLAAGIERASSLIAAIGSDSDNLALTLTARSMRSDLRIVARVAEQRNERKFLRAGADEVVNPYDIGGSRMAAIAFRPHVAEFLDKVMRADEHDVDFYELVVSAGSRADGQALTDVTGGDTIRALVVAIKGADGDYTVNPHPTRVLTAGDILIAIGSTAQIDRLATSVA